VTAVLLLPLVLEQPLVRFGLAQASFNRAVAHSCCVGG